MTEKQKIARPGANEIRPHLPRGTTAVSHGGELYVLGSSDPLHAQDPNKFYNLDGKEVDLPDDFPDAASFEERAAKLNRGFSGIPGGYPIQQHMSKGSSGTTEPGNENDRREGEEDFEDMTKDDLEARATELGLEVKSTGETDRPVKADYVKALRKHARSQQ